MAIDWALAGDRVCEILTMIYVERRPRLMREARRQGIDLEQLAAAAIAGFFQEVVEQAEKPRARPNGSGPLQTGSRPHARRRSANGGPGPEPASDTRGRKTGRRRLGGNGNC